MSEASRAIEVENMLVSHAKHGADSDAFKSAVETMDLLIWSVNTKRSLDERRRLAGVAADDSAAHAVPGFERVHHEIAVDAPWIRCAGDRLGPVPLHGLRLTSILCINL